MKSKHILLYVIHKCFVVATCHFIFDKQFTHTKNPSLSYIDKEGFYLFVI